MKPTTLTPAQLFRQCIKAKPVLPLGEDGRLFWTPIPTNQAVDFRDLDWCKLITDETGKPIITRTVLNALSAPAAYQCAKQVKEAWDKFPNMINPQLDTLKEGALADWINRDTAQRIGALHRWEAEEDIMRLEIQPERYWQLPHVDMLDCHWIVYHLCVNMVIEDRKEQATEFRLNQQSAKDA